MRLVFVLSIGAALIWAYLEFFPTREPLATGEAAGARAQAPALTSDDVVQEPGPKPSVHEPAPLPQVAGNPFAPASGVARAQVDAEVGASLAHGASAELERLLAEHASLLGPVRVGAIQAFVAALSGDVAEARAAGQSIIADENGLTAEERVHLAAALGAGEVPGPERPASGPIARAMAIRLHARLADFEADDGRAADAARRLGQVLALEFDAPWQIDDAAMAAWCDRLREVQRRHRWNPRGDWPGIELTAEPGDSWIALRQRAMQARDGLVVSAGLIARANGTAADGTLRLGQSVKVPTEPVSVLVDLSQRWMLYRIGAEVVDAFPVGVGREGEETPSGEFLIGTKQVEPVHWSDKGPIPFGDPANELGTRWLAWRVEGEGADTPYGFHGTWDPPSIGRASSEGCVRMRNEDVEFLYEVLPAGARVVVRD